MFNTLNKTLPIHSLRKMIIDAVNDSPVTLISSETGSGKSTQVPQYLYEAGYDVIVTEPRRLAAVTLANRVAEELNNFDVVSYHTGFETTETSLTRILFCTDGLHLVRSLASRKTVRKTALIIDEIHEQNLNQEMLLAWSKHMMAVGWNVKLVLMSATVDTNKYSSYYNNSMALLTSAGSCYPVESHQVSEYKMESLIRAQAESGHNVLVFLPGKKEIFQLQSDLLQHHLDVELLVLHGDLTMQEQQSCFESYNRPKIVLATNIAQTSVTVPDIDCVIDSGLERRVETREGIQGVFLHHISKADIIQRRGRAGRTHPGIYYLCSSVSEEYREEYNLAEIQRVSLEQVVLRFMAAGLNPYDLDFFHDVSIELLDTAFNLLTLLGALDGSGLTSIGKRMAAIPISARYARMLLEAEKYGIVGDALILSAILEVGSIVSKEATYYSQEMESCQSDIQAEVLLWKAIKSFNTKYLSNAGYNAKSVFRAKELIEKLTRVVSQTMAITSTGDSSHLSMVYFSGMIDQLYARINFESYANPRATVKIDNKSLLSMRMPALVTGTPRTIEFKDKWGRPMTMNLLTMCAPIDVGALLLEYPQYISYEDNESESHYIVDEDVAAIYQDVAFNGTCISYRIKKESDTPLAIKLREEYLEHASRRAALRDKPARQPAILLEGVRLPLLYDWRSSQASVYVDVNLLLETSATTIKIDTGMSVLFKCNGMASMNLQDLKAKVIQTAYSNGLKSFKTAIPSAYTVKPKLIQDYKQMVGKHAITSYPYPIQYVYVALDVCNKQFGLKIFESEQDATTSTNSALEYMLVREIESMYGPNQFSIQVDNKLLFTKKCEAIRKQFLDSIQDLLHAVTLSSFEETQEFVAEMYKEIATQLVAI